MLAAACLFKVNAHIHMGILGRAILEDSRAIRQHCLAMTSATASEGGVFYAFLA